jgi:Zn-dependent protease
MDANVAEIIQRIVIMFPAFLLALVVHEFAHAWMATRFGDQTAQWNGRLTLNPLAHIDPIGTILLPLVGMLFPGGMLFGWAKPVPIDPRKFSHYRKGLFWVAFAGPLSNLIFGFLAMVAFVAVHVYVPRSSGYYEASLQFTESLSLVNFMLAVFNLIPIPPMDGSNIVLSFLSYNATQKFLQLQQYSFMLFIFLMFSGAFRIIGIPVYALANLSQSLAARLFGLA